MRVLKVPETGAKRKLLDAAERLVVENGFESVSVRDVTGAVGANVAAVNYHFGSREGLMDLVMMRVLDPLCQERLRTLGSAEKQHSGKMTSPLECISAYVNALAATSARIGMDHGFFLKLAGKTLVLPEDILAPVLAMARASVTERYLGALARACPTVGAKDLAARWRFFDAGLSQAIQSLAPDEMDTPDVWIEFGVKGFGSGLPAAEKAEDDAQGMLFDF